MTRSTNKHKSPKKPAYDPNWWKRKFKVTVKSGKGSVPMPDLSCAKPGLAPTSNRIPGGTASRKSVLDATLPGRANKEKPAVLAATEALKGRISVAYNKGPVMLLPVDELRTVRGKV